jgi:F0F1-type ATP synthase epsilon subunit
MTSNPPILKVRILSPREVIFEGDALSVSSKNLSGNFDILPLHANFITLIEKNQIKITKLDHTNQNFNFPIAILYQVNNQVNIYTDLEFK